MNSAARNPNHGLRWAFMMTLLTSRCHYRKIPCPAALNLKRYFTAWEATAAYPPRKIILKLSVILRRGMRKVISFMTLKSWRAHGIAPARQRKPIRSAYLIAQADFVGCHQLQFIDKYQMAERLKPGGIFLLNTPYSADEVWSRLPQEVQAVLNQKKARFTWLTRRKSPANVDLAPASIPSCKWLSST